MIDGATGARAEGIRGIVYDLDGTLYTISWLKLNITMGLLFDTKRLRALFKARDAVREETFDSRRALMRSFAKELAARAGGTAEETLDWYEHRFMPRFVTVLGRRGRVREGLVPLLERAAARGVRQAVVSDFGMIRERLDALGIPSSLFDDLVGAEELGVMKPSAAPYRLLAERWGISLAELLLVGDRADQDEMSATLAGARFIGIADETPQGAFRLWPEVIRYIDDITGAPG